MSREGTWGKWGQARFLRPKKALSVGQAVPWESDFHSHLCNGKRGAGGGGVQGTREDVSPILILHKMYVGVGVEAVKW